jgi:hypothetical protein
MSVFAVYKTDNWHSYASRDLIGIATTFNNAIRLCKQQAKKEHTLIEEDQLFNLRNIKQTQGYIGEGEFHFEELPTNQLF